MLRVTRSHEDEPRGRPHSAETSSLSSGVLDHTVLGLGWCIEMEIPTPIFAFWVFDLWSLCTFHGRLAAAEETLQRSSVRAEQKFNLMVLISHICMHFTQNHAHNFEQAF